MGQSLIEFESQYPEYALDFSLPLATQLRIYEIQSLESLPEELTTAFEYRSGGRGRPNRNQTRTHSQCATCRKVLRNDYFYAPPSMIRKNVVYSHCKTCAQQLNEEHYIQTSSTIRSNRFKIWSYLTVECACCGFQQHASALEFHHPEGEAKEAHVSALVDDFAQSQNPHKGERLLKEAGQCTVLCSNCHHMLHAQAINLPATIIRQTYRLDTLMKLARNQ